MTTPSELFALAHKAIDDFASQHHKLLIDLETAVQVAVPVAEQVLPVEVVRFLSAAVDLAPKLETLVSSALAASKSAPPQVSEQTSPPAEQQAEQQAVTENVPAWRQFFHKD